MRTSVVHSLRERPDLLGPWLAMEHTWPEFLLHTVPPRVEPGEVRRRFADFRLFGMAGGEVVAHIHGALFCWNGRRADLPADWNAIVERAVGEARCGCEPTLLPRPVRSVQARIGGAAEGACSVSKHSRACGQGKRQARFSP